MIEVQHLVFEYPGLCALDDVSCVIRRGDVTALVGPNGAGKTTLMRCLAALDRPLSGTITIDGLDVLAHPRQCHRRIGYVPDFFGLFAELTVGQSLRYLARAHGLPAADVEPAVQHAVRRLQLDDRLEQKTSTLSRGLSQRVAIAQAIVHSPEVLLLDEPASGLDPEARQRLADLFLELQAEGMTLIVSSHILAELEAYASSMIILRAGRLVEHRRLRGEAVATASLALAVARPVPDLIDRLQARPGISDVRGDGHRATFRFAADRGAQSELLRSLITDGLPVSAFAEERANLQETYLASLRASEGGPPA